MLNLMVKNWFLTVSIEQAVLGISFMSLQPEYNFQKCFEIQKRAVVLSLEPWKVLKTLEKPKKMLQNCYENFSENCSWSRYFKNLYHLHISTKTFQSEF